MVTMVYMFRRIAGFIYYDIFHLEYFFSNVVWVHNVMVLIVKVYGINLNLSSTE